MFRSRYTILGRPIEGLDGASRPARPLLDPELDTTTGQPLNRERPIILGAGTVPNVEGHTHGRAISERLDDRRGHRPWHVQKLLVREPGGPTAGRQRS
jgi:hypothetical protein